MKKVKVFKIVNTIILLLILGNSTTLAKKISQQENLIESTKQEKIHDENSSISDLQESEITEINAKEFEVENFKIEKIYTKNYATLVLYEHIKSGAKFVVWFEKLDPEGKNISIKFKDPTMFFRYIPTNNFGIAHILRHLLVSPMYKKLKDNFTSTELETITNYDKLIDSEDLLYKNGIGFKFDIKKWTPKVVDIVTNELKDPTFLKDNKKLFSGEKKKIILELKERELVEKQNGLTQDQRNPKSFDRFVGCKFFARGLIKDFEKLSLKTTEKEFKENIIPENILIQISERLNPDYKQIMKRFDKNYLKNYIKKNSFKKDKQKLKTTTETETETVRQIYVDQIGYEKFNFYQQKNYKQKFKGKAKIYWKIENLSPKEKEIFNIKSENHLILKHLDNEIKKLGYENVIVNYNDILRYSDIENPLHFDDLFYLDLYGNDLSKFEEKTLKENSKKILNMIYEKIKNFDDNELLTINRASFKPFRYENNYYRYENDFNIQMNKSFALTNEPINEKFFDIEGQTIKDDYANKRVLENLKKYKDNFKKIIDLPPTYIDIFSTKKAKNDENLKTDDKITDDKITIESYANPVTFKSSNKLLKGWAEQLTQDLFIIPNITDKGLCSDKQKYFPWMNIFNTEIKKIEEYLCNKFIKDFKNFKPTMEQFKKLNDNDRKGNKLKIKKLENKIENLNKILKNPKNLKKLALIEKQLILYKESQIKYNLKELEEILKYEKNKKIVKASIEENKKNLESISEIKDNVKYFINKVKERINNEIKSLKTHLDEVRKKENLRNKIKYEDFVNIFKNAEVKTSSHLKKYNF